MGKEREHMNKTLRKVLDKNKRLLRPKSSQKWVGKKFIGLFRPGVYIMFNKEEPIYVGKCGGQVIKRAVVSNETALNNASALQILPCINPEAAVKLERILILELQPKYNKRG